MTAISSVHPSLPYPINAPLLPDAGYRQQIAARHQASSRAGRGSVAMGHRVKASRQTQIEKSNMKWTLVPYKLEYITCSF